MVDELTALAVAARDGDRFALGAFVRRSQADVWRYCAHLAGRAQADDLTQETFVRALRALSAFRGDASARTWLLTIARNTVADAIRRERRRRTFERVTSEPVEPVADDVPARAEVRALLVALEPDRRAAFVLTQLLGLTYAEAAAVCGCEIGTIRSRVSRARADLVTLVDQASA
jgi:RNA polymerase sigma-70 factor (ECF subfamily)